jgi:hypothetical protein
MRLSEWRAAAPTRESMTLKVLAVVEPVLSALGAERDPFSWVAWGDDPSVRYTVLVPGVGGLIVCHVRVNIPGEGPRASAKLTRWPRVQLGELAIETQSGHRLVSFQVDQYVLRGVDAEADRIANFALALFAAVDGRPMPELAKSRAGRGKTATTKRAATRKATRKPKAVASSSSASAIGEQPVQKSA